MTRIAALFGAAALVGCASVEDPSDSVNPRDVRAPATLPDAGTPQNATFDVLATYSNGLLAAHDTFDLKDPVHVDTVEHGHAPASRYPTGEGTDYTFEVVDGNGWLVSQDDATCRRIHIDGHGQISKVYAATDTFGEACQHKTGVDGAGGLTVQLMPYGDSSLVIDDAGTKKMVFDVVLRPAPLPDDGGGVIGAKRLPQYRFYVALQSPADPPVCGNGVREGGEQCDDGNRECGDGCDGECMIEPTGAPAGSVR